MKLKRCPNLHYYDGDKYDRCPHCAGASEPAPAPKPIIEPAPEPVQEKPAAAAAEPKPIPVPVPAPAAKPEQPVISDTPAPAVIPKPSEAAPAPVKQEAPKPAASEDVWVCSCGAENKGRFCYQCGSPKPQPKPEPVKEPEPEPVQDNTWTCACGAVNEGRFCSECGAPRPEAKPAAPAAEPVPVQEIKQEIPQPAAEPEKTLTEQISEAKFIGTAEEARSKANSRADEGVTQVIFDEIDDDLVIAWLAVVNTSSRGKIFTLSRPRNTVGRSDPEHPVDIDLRNDRGVSRGAQAMIVYDPLNKKFFLQSTGGKTFVYVNKELLLDHTELKAYDIIKVGETDLVFVPLCTDKFTW